ncbi:MAG: PEP-CTERM sorting domain-containing protein [Phycisphaerae bacterium]
MGYYAASRRAVRALAVVVCGFWVVLAMPATAGAQFDPGETFEGVEADLGPGSFTDVTVRDDPGGNPARVHLQPGTELTGTLTVQNTSSTDGNDVTLSDEAMLEDLGLLTLGNSHVYSLQANDASHADLSGCNLTRASLHGQATALLTDSQSGTLTAYSSGQVIVRGGRADMVTGFAGHDLLFEDNAEVGHVSGFGGTIVLRTGTDAEHVGLREGSTLEVDGAQISNMTAMSGSTVTLRNAAVNPAGESTGGLSLLGATLTAAGGTIRGASFSVSGASEVSLKGTEVWGDYSNGDGSQTRMENVTLHGDFTAGAGEAELIATSILKDSSGVDGYLWVQGSWVQGSLDDAHLTLRDGCVARRLHVIYPGAEADVYGLQLYATDVDTVGRQVEAMHGGIVRIYGTGFNYSLGPIADSDGVLTGTLTDGTEIEWTFYRDDASTIQLVPEPATMLLLVPAGVAAVLRRRCGRTGR